MPKASPPRKSAAKPKKARRTPKAAKPKTPARPRAAGAPEISAWIKDLGGWRGQTLARMRALIRDAAPGVVEEIKWRKPTNPAGVPVWSHEGILCTGEAYKDRVKLTFMHGAALADPKKLFNASLTAGTRRAIDIHEGESVDEAGFRALVREAVKKNVEARAG